MTSVTEFNRRRPAPALGTFERYLTVWVALCIIAGIVLGRLVPGTLQGLGRMRRCPGKECLSPPQPLCSRMCVDSLNTSAEVRLGLFKDALGLALRALDPTSFDDADRRPHAHTDLDVVLGPACELGVLRGGRSTAAITCRKRTPYSHAPTHFKKV